MSTNRENKETKKIINVNPELFSIKGVSKTRKKKTFDTATVERPIITPQLQQKILARRLKEHKLKQMEKQLHQHPLPIIKPHITPPAAAAAHTDDFADSMDYLQTLSSTKNLREKELYDKIKQRKREEAYRKTIHNPYRLRQHVDMADTPLITVDLPKGLNDDMAFPNRDDDNIFGKYAANSVVPSYNVDNAVPYGILRSGIKPTFSDWRKTQKARPSMQSLPQKGTSDRETRMNIQRKLQMLRDRLKPSVAAPAAATPLQPETPTVSSSTADMLSTPIKRRIKKTIKHRYTLGRSKVRRTIDILIKNNTTRRHIIDAHKELKTHSMADIRRYLREHNLIKIGDNAPNDVLRKLYESAILSGDVTNTNTHTLLHNLTKDAGMDIETVFTDAAADKM